MQRPGGTLFKRLMPLPSSVPPSIRKYWRPVAIVAGVVVISFLHYYTSVHSVLLHEVFTRLYYVPIVIAAVTFGLEGALATSVFSSLLYLPHIALDWHDWPILELGQYGEVIVFNVVAAVTGVLVNRLHAERNRYRHAAIKLQQALAHVQASLEERLRVDRLVTLGRLSSGIAHEVRNPLGGLLGCLEILEEEFECTHPKAEFIAIAKKEVGRLNRLATAFLEFARPVPPASQAVDLPRLAEAAVQLARPSLSRRHIHLDVQPSGTGLLADGDAEQLQRALLNIILDSDQAPCESRIDLRVDRTDVAASITIDMHGVQMPPGGPADIFEPFSDLGRGDGLALATARRLIENQKGSIRAELADNRLRYVIELPLSKPAGTTSSCRSDAEVA